MMNTIAIPYRPKAAIAATMLAAITLGVAGCATGDA